ncbi:acetyl-CoA synthetase-like protein [Macrolepiota fuliginosa MF-IS2]|uniref:Acetyl-CoA synthetase-like protein n=1 Tax=Macrolepiota fuliginosa MF-IS2 TaxID=1400762 RepID=A0A9P5XBM1_9AGAR|nr:acetyl-CoA synthetase-like protein [Macrolepiota fuliginosa MF-IS2]
MEIHSLRPLPESLIPDDQTIGQFVFDSKHPARPKTKEGVPWFIDDATGRSFGEQEIRGRTTTLASALRYKYGIGEDDVVLLYSRNHTDFPIAIWAVHQLGGIISGANPDFSTNELLYQVQATKATLMIVHPDSISVAEAAAQQYGLSSDRILVFNTVNSPGTHKVSVEDMVQLGRTHAPAFEERRLKPGEGKTKLAFLSFSSGTTGRPKAVAIPHYAPIVNVLQIAVHNRVNEDYCPWEDRRYRPGDVAIQGTPNYIFNIYGLVVNLHFVLFSRMSIVVVPKFNFVGMLKSIVRHKISHLYLVPPMVILLCKHPAVKNYRLHEYIRMVMCGAAPLSHELNQQLFELLPDAHIGQAYGMTETCTATTMWSIDKKRGISGSSGKLVPGTVVKIVKQDGTLAGYNEPGELIIWSASNALCYLNNAEATKETFVDGWVRTGDEVKIDQDGEVWVLDRLKEIMKVKGFQVAPAELEGCILEHKDVLDTCVVGAPDDYSGEVPLAFVVLRADAAKKAAQDPKEADVIRTSIIKHVANNKIAYKHLAGGVEFVDVIPTSPSGKLLRRVLRDRAKELKQQQEVKAKL